MFGISVFLCLWKAEGIMDWCAEAAAEQASAGAKCLSEVVGIERIEPVNASTRAFCDQRSPVLVTFSAKLLCSGCKPLNS
jgi:hypothetical protein